MNLEIEDMLAEFWAWAYFTGPRTRAGFSFPDAEGFVAPPPNAIETEDWVVRNLADRETISRSTFVDHLGAWIVRFSPDADVGGIELNLSAAGAWTFLAAVATENGVDFIEAVDGRIEIPNWGDYDDIIFVGATGELSGWDYRLSYTAEYSAALTRPTPTNARVTLHGNRPNPFNSGTEIPFELDEDGRVTMRVYDALGRRVRTLFTDRLFTAGPQVTAWDGKTDLTRPATTGVYFIRASTLNSQSTIRVVLAR